MTETTLAWVKGENIKAVRGDDGVERLFVDDRLIPLTDAHHHPTQQVINYCHGGKRARLTMRRFWIELEG
jgi:hypothetical protein